MTIPNYLLDGMYELLCHLSTDLTPHEIRQAMVELLGTHQITSLDAAKGRRAFHIAVVIDGRLSPNLRGLSLFCSQPLAILLLLRLYIEFHFQLLSLE